jgi:hypothetical protein
MRDDAHRQTIYVREDAVVPKLDALLARWFDPDHIDETVEQLLAAVGPTDEDTAGVDAAQRQLVECDASLVKYRAAIDNGADPTVVAAWISETQGDRLAALREIADARPVFADEDGMRAMLGALGPMADVFSRADSEKKARLYADLGITMTHDAARDVVTVEARPRVRMSVSEGGLEPPRPCGH